MARFIQTKQQSEENSFSGTPEQMLWVAVLSRAAEDITKTSDWVAAREAINWVKRKNKDFKLVCEMAGRNPDYVHVKLIPKCDEKETEIESHFQRIKELQTLGIVRKYGERRKYKKRIRLGTAHPTQANL